MTPKHPGLTARQEEALDLLANGCDLHGVARTMQIEYSTARQHVQDACEALGATGARHAIAIWVEYRVRSEVPS